MFLYYFVLALFPVLSILQVNKTQVNSSPSQFSFFSLCKKRSTQHWKTFRTDVFQKIMHCLRCLCMYVSVSWPEGFKLVKQKRGMSKFVFKTNDTNNSPEHSSGWPLGNIAVQPARPFSSRITCATLIKTTSNTGQSRASVSVSEQAFAGSPSSWLAINPLGISLGAKMRTWKTF